MANVNLISARRAERVRMTKVARGLAMAIGATAVIGVIGAAWLGGCMLKVESDVREADGKLGRLRPIRKQIEADEKERQALQPKLTTLSEAQKRTSRWYGIMEGLKHAVPEETWLTAVSVEKGGAETPANVRIDGVTVSQSRVGETMFRLSQQPDFYKKVDLRYSQANVAQKDQVEFELVAQMNQPELEKKAEKKDDPNATKAN
jgi:Tfp pilus assembly protein PilN